MRTARISALLSAAALLAAYPLGAQTLTLDPHLDLPKSAGTPGWDGRSDPSSQFDLERARRGGLNAAAIAVFVPQGPRDGASLAKAGADLKARDAAVHAIAERNPGLAALARSPAEVRAIAASGRFAVIESLLNAWPLGNDLDEIDYWYSRGVRIFGFIHAGHNQFADSSRPALPLGDRPEEHGGLSALGERAVKRLNDLGIVIDVSQLSDAAFAQVLKISRAPVIATHSDVRALVDNSRNLTDAQLDALKARRGVIAINAFSAYLRPRSPETNRAVETLQRALGVAAGSPLPADKQEEYSRRYHEILAREPRASVKELVDAVDYTVRRIGVDHVALSSDFNHGGGVEGWSDVGELGNVTAELKRRGYTSAQIDKLWSGNVLRAWQEAIDARDPNYRPVERKPA